MLPVSNVDECTQYIIINTQYNETVCFLIKCTIKWQIAQRQIHPCHAHPGTIYRFANLLFYCKIIPPTNQFGESAVEHARHDTGGSNLGNLGDSEWEMCTYTCYKYVRQYKIRDKRKFETQRPPLALFSATLSSHKTYPSISPHTSPYFMCSLCQYKNSPRIS